MTHILLKFRWAIRSCSADRKATLDTSPARAAAARRNFLSALFTAALTTRCVPVSPVPDGDTLSAPASLSANCKASSLNIYSVCAGSTGASDDGTMAHPWTGWEAALNALPGGAAGGATTAQDIYFQSGFYKQTVRIDLKAGWHVHGAGRQGTLILVGPGYNDDAFRYQQSPQNTVAPVWITIEDMSIAGPGVANTVGAAIDDIGGANFNVTRVVAYGFAYSVIFDQVQDSDIENSYLGPANVTAVWLVNGAAHISGNAGGATNRVGIHQCQIDPGAGTPIGIVDDGGDAHIIESCNFNGGNPSIRIAGTTNARISGSSFEPNGDAIVNATTTLGGLSEGPNTSLTINDNTINATGHHAIVLASSSPVFMSNNNFSGFTGAAVTGVNTVFQMHSFGNIPGSFDSDSTIGTFANGIGLGIGTSLPTGPLDIKGDRLRIRRTFTPATSAAPGNIGDIAWDATFLYVYTAAGWRRVPLGAAF